MTEITIQNPIESSDSLRQEIDNLISEITSDEIRIATRYARLGRKLWEVEKTQAWGDWGYERFSSYLEDVRTRINRRRSQVYAIISVAKNLLPLISEELLETVGITKAQELSRFVREGGNLGIVVDRIGIIAGNASWGEDVDLVGWACNKEVTAVMLRAKINDILHIKEEARGTWYSLDGFYATPDERKEIEQFWSVGHAVLSLKSEGDEFENRKQVFLASAREFVATYAQQVS